MTTWSSTITKRSVLLWAALLDASGAKRVILCAQHDIAAGFKRALPKAVAGAVVAEIPLDAASTVGQMVAGFARGAAKGQTGEVGRPGGPHRGGAGPGWPRGRRVR